MPFTDSEVIAAVKIQEFQEDPLVDSMTASAEKILETAHLQDSQTVGVVILRILNVDGKAGLCCHPTGIVPGPHLLAEMIKAAHPVAEGSKHE